MPVSGRRSARRGVSSSSPAPSRDDLYAQVTTRIIAEMEAGRVPWVQPWDGAAATTGLPRNALSGRAYSGINILLLWGAVIERGYSCQGWLTFGQALQAGGAVRKGEQGVTVVYADCFTPEAERERARETGDEARSIAFLKRFTLFNVAQCDGLPERIATAAPALPEREAIPVAETLIAATRADFRIGGARAYYAPAEDYVRVPPQPAFRDQINYYRTALHELTHNAAPRIMPNRRLKDAGFPGSLGSAFGIIFVQLASRSRVNFCARRLQPEGADFNTLNMSDFLPGLRAWLRRDRFDQSREIVGIMPNARKENAPESVLPGTPFGIIRDTALWPLCRYRHNGHWTGHVSRLARDQSGSFGSQAYAREELCAELGSAFLCAALGIVPTVRHADYLASWLDLLRADNRAIFRAASHASKAADFLLACRDPACDPELPSKH